MRGCCSSAIRTSSRRAVRRCGLLLYLFGRDEAVRLLRAG
jgi:hypothetical protein